MQLSMLRSVSRAAVGGFALVASAACFAGSGALSSAGEALDAERPSMRTPIASNSSTHAVVDVVMVKDVSAPLTRQEVKDQLAEARAAGALPHPGEIADTPQVMAARNELIDRDARRIVAVTWADSVSVAELGSISITNRLP
jgi:hypothetical protein